MALASAQVVLGVWVAGEPTWVMVAASTSAGAVIAHALGVLIHEASHNLVFRRAWKNKALAILANVAHGAPAAIQFRHEHLLHHRYLGDAGEPEGRDTQAPTRKEVVFVGRSAPRKLLSFAFGRFFYRARPANAQRRDGWLLANIAACVLTDALLLGTVGWLSTAYLLASSLVAFGPHVVGARRVAEHLTVRRGQPTNSYYGPLNRLSFCVGYHVEHHDFPAVPWRRLRLLRAMAYNHYEQLATVTSWSRLMLKYFLDSRLSVSHYAGLSTEHLEEELGAERQLQCVGVQSGSTGLPPPARTRGRAGSIYARGGDRPDGRTAAAS
ncbi:MAG: fatty acid desaturase [Polyangiaceae bacterium]